MSATKKAPARLSQLYTTKTGVIPFDVDDPETGETTKVNVVIVKPNVDDMEEIERRAAAARSRLRMKLADPGSDESLAAKDQAAMAGPLEAKSLIVGIKTREKNLTAYYEVRAKDEWSENDHLAGLESLYYSKDEFHAGMTMEMLCASPPEGESHADEDARDAYIRAYTEACEVRDEIGRFHAQVEAKVQSERDNLAGQLDQMPPEKIVEETEKVLRDLMLEKAYADAYDRQVLYYATRQAENLRARYFEGVHEVNELDDSVRGMLHVAYTEIAVSPMEGKGSPGTPGSSTPSESIDEEAASMQSGPTDAAA